MNDDDRLKAAWSQLTLVLGFYPKIDTKLSVVLGLNLGMLAMLATQLTGRPNLSAWHFILAAAAGVPLALCLFHLYRGGIPDTRGGGTSMVYFGRIAELSESEFLAAYKERSPAALADDLLEQAWRNSKILARKFSSLQSAYKMLLVAAVPWVALLALLAWS